MKHQYLYGLQRGEKVYGIPDEETLEKLIVNGSLQSCDMLFCYRRGLWSPAGELPELKSRFSGSTLRADADEEAVPVSAYASVSGTHKMLGSLKSEKPETGGGPPGGSRKPKVVGKVQVVEVADESDSADLERSKSTLLIIAIALLLLLLSALLAARLYVFCTKDSQLSYNTDAGFTDRVYNSPSE